MLIKKRIKGVAIFFLVALCLLIIRLIQIQLISTESYSKHRINLIEQSVNQRVQSIVLDGGRGKFYDRNGTLLNYEPQITLILFPFLNNMDWPVEKIAEIIDVAPSQLIVAIRNEKEPFTFEENGQPISLTENQMEQLNALKIPGVFAASILKPIESRLAEQLIGGVTNVNSAGYEEEGLSPNDKVGDRGLERQLDAYLRSQGESKLVYHVDGMGGPLFGVHVKYVSPGSALYPVKVNTTLDSQWQRVAEELADEEKIQKGGLLVIDIESSEIIVSVSRPRVDTKDPYKDNGAQNKMLTQSTVGSVFKTVVAAAAIEEKMVDDSQIFDCDRTINGGIEKERPLGMLHFNDSFAQSCNRTFGELGIALSKKNPALIQEYAEKLQLVGQSGWEGNVFHSSLVQLHNEEKGQVWREDVDFTDSNFIAQTAIGQKDVQATPLAVANMMATIARGGERKMVKAVSGIEFANGTTAARFEDDEVAGETISAVTAKKLQQLLREVVEDGTASSLQDLPINIAGKTGTAQTDVDNRLVNMWFAGYFPAEKPKYAFVVVKLGVSDQEKSATRTFGEYIKKIYAQNLIK